MCLFENELFSNLQSGKKYAYLEAYMSWPAERWCSGGSSPLTFFEKEK